MIPIDNDLVSVLVSDEIAERFFVCHFEKCKGACCQAGDKGAPLDNDEGSVLRNIYPAVAPYLSEEGRQEIKKNGLFLKDSAGRLTTPSLQDGRCVYATTDENKSLRCGIEQAYLEGKTDFKKPISCHLYPIRITKYPSYDAVNYETWDICKPACTLGTEKQVPLYVFLKEALIRKYGEAWYGKLRDAIEPKFNS